jgi:predicted dehydrogenase
MDPPVRVGLLGCGTTADDYATTLAAAGSRVTLGACADLLSPVARAFADRHAIPRVVEPEKLLDPGLVDLVVVLTPLTTRATLALAAVEAGLPAVYVASPLGMSVDEAYAVVRAGQAAGTLVDAAPDTVLGAPAQTARAALVAGMLGRPVSVAANCLSAGPSQCHPDPDHCHAEGIGPLVDLGPYYLTMLAYLLAPIDAVRGALSHSAPPRMIDTGLRAGEGFPARGPTHVSALLETITGVPVTFTAGFEAHGTTCPPIEIHGTEASLLMPDPTFHSGEVLVRGRTDAAWHPVPGRPSVLGPVGRGMGVLELADALLGHPRQRACTAELAAHVASIITAIRTAARSAAYYPVAGALRDDLQSVGGATGQRDLPTGVPR